MTHANIPFQSLYAITEWNPDREARSILTDIRDLGLADAWIPLEQSRARTCPIYLVAGPEDDRFGPEFGNRPHWTL